MKCAACGFNGKGRDFPVLFGLSRPNDRYTEDPAAGLINAHACPKCGTVRIEVK